MYMKEKKKKKSAAFFSSAPTFNTAINFGDRQLRGFTSFNSTLNVLYMKGNAMCVCL